MKKKPITRRRQFVRGMIAAAGAASLAVASTTPAQAQGKAAARKKAAAKKKASPAKKAASGVTAATVGKVTYLDPNSNAAVSIAKNPATGQWQEASPNGPFTFKEVKRDGTSVHLFDGDRGMAMRIDLSRKSISYGSADASQMLSSEFGSYPIQSATR